MTSNSLPGFSVIVPVYNTEKELPRCIDSILMQKYIDLEVILVNDGSSDQSGKICDRYAAVDGRVKVIHQENAGCSAARNAGVYASQKDYLLFVDSDDAWEGEDKLLQIAEAALAQHIPDVVLFGIGIYHSDGSFEKRIVPDVTDGDDLDKERVLRSLVYRYQFISASYCKAVKRKFFLDNELFFKRGMLSEDIEWSAKLMVLSREICVCPVELYKRIRREEGAITAQIGKKNIQDILTAIETGIIFAKDHAENAKMLALYYEYWAYQYAMLLSLLHYVNRERELPDILSRMKTMSWLLRYDHVKKVRIVHTIYMLFGMRATVNLLSVRYKISNH